MKKLIKFVLICCLLLFVGLTAIGMYRLEQSPELKEVRQEAKIKKHSFIDEYICKAALFVSVDIGIKSIKTYYNEKGVYKFSYIRKADSKSFRYEYKIQGNQVRYRNITLGDPWNKTIKVYWSVSGDGKRLSIKEYYTYNNEKELWGNKIFVIKDFM